MLAALVCLVAARPPMKFHLYMFAALLALEFLAASARWSPREINLIDIDLENGSVAMRFEVLRVGLNLLWAAVLMSAARTLTPQQARRVVRVATIAFLVQLIVVALLAVFEKEALAFFYPDPANQGEG